MGKMIFNQEESFLLSDSEYSIDTALAIRRRTVHRTDDENMITRRDYLIDGKRITVNSVFNMLKNQSAVNCDLSIGLIFERSSLCYIKPITY